MKNRCANYDKEIECCRILSDWSEAMPALQPCIENPCKYFKPYTNYDRIKSMSVEEMAEFNVTHDAEYNMYLSLNGFLYGTKEGAIQKNIEWLLQEVRENEHTRCNGTSL